MVSKKNFQQNGRGPQRQARVPSAPYQKPFRPQGGNNMMFNASQIPDNPGYMDFNNPTPSLAATASQQNQQQQQKKKNNKNKPKNKVQLQQQGSGSQQQHQQQNNNGNNWNRNRNPQQNRFGNGPQRGFNNQGRPMLNRGHRMMPPIGPSGPRVGPMPPLPPHHLAPNGFQIPPMIPPMPPMGRVPMPPMGVGNAHFLRRGVRGGPMPPIPPPMPPMMAGGNGPRTRRNIPPIGIPLPPVPFNGIGPGGKVKKPNPKLVKKVVKGKSTIKTLKNLANQYTLDKPWVTAEIRAEHDKKVDIENRLKGNKDDDLFAQFKAQRDKFVSMYETAREAYIKKEAEAVKAKDDKDKQTNTTAAKDGNKKEVNANTKVNANIKVNAKANAKTKAKA